MARLDLALHRASFQLANLHHDAHEKTLTLAFEHSRPSEWQVHPVVPFVWRIEAPVRMWRMTCREVATVQINDEAEVGTYQFDDISWQSTVLRIEAIPPLIIEASCERPDILIELGNDVVSTRTFKTFSLRAPTLAAIDPLAP
jgi:hypothetical protein